MKPEMRITMMINIKVQIKHRYKRKVKHNKSGIKIILRTKQK